MWWHGRGLGSLLRLCVPGLLSPAEVPCLSLLHWVIGTEVSLAHREVSIA